MVTSKLRFILPWKHWEADDEVYCVEQGTYFVHYIPVNEFIVWELQKSTQNINHEHVKKKEKKWWTDIKNGTFGFLDSIDEMWKGQLYFLSNTSTRTCSKFGQIWIFILDLVYIVSPRILTLSSSTEYLNICIHCAGYHLKAILFLTWLIGRISCWNKLLDGSSQLFKLYDYTCMILW